MKDTLTIVTIISFALLFLFLAMCDAVMYADVIDTYGNSEKLDGIASVHYGLGKTVNDLVVGSN